VGGGAGSWVVGWGVCEIQVTRVNNKYDKRNKDKWTSEQVASINK